MTIYEHRASMVCSGGSSSSTTLYCPGGIANQFLVRANTSSALFRANLTDENGVVRVNYGFTRGEINDQDIRLAIVGSYGVNITNATADDTFTVILAIEERN